MSQEKTKYCEIRDCTRAHSSYTEKLGPRIGLCSTHYSQLAKYGYLTLVTGCTPRNKPYGVETCQVGDCTHPPKASHVVNGHVLFLCTTHLSRWTKHRDLERVDSPPVRPRRNRTGS